MPWSTLISLITQYGIPFAVSMYTKWTTPTPVTQADIDALILLGKNTARTHLVAALQRAGIALDSPQAVQLLAMVPADPVAV